MIKQLTQLEHKIEDRVYHFVCDPNAPIQEVKDALMQFIKVACQVEDQVKAAQAAQKAAEVPAAEPESQPPEAA